MNSFKKVLLVDDDQINNFVCETIIKSNKFAEEVKSFEEAEEAITYLKKTAQEAPESFPDLIFLDLNMPGMDGWTFIDEYRTIAEDITSTCNLFMLSSAVDRKDIISAKTHKEIKDFFSKPLSTEILDFIREEFTH